MEKNISQSQSVSDDLPINKNQKPLTDVSQSHPTLPLTQNKKTLWLLILILALFISGVIVTQFQNQQNQKKAIEIADNINDSVNNKFKIAYIGDFTKEALTPILYTSNIDGTNKVIIADLTQIFLTKADEENFSKSYIGISDYLPDSNLIIIKQKSIFNFEENIFHPDAFYSVDLNTQEIKPYTKSRMINGKCKGENWMVMNDWLSINIDHIFYDGEDSIGNVPQTEFINYKLCNHETGAIKIIEDPENEINKKQFVQDIGQKNIIFNSSKTAYVMNTWNGYNNQIDSQFEQLDLITGEITKPTNLNPIESKLNDGMSIKYVTKLFKDNASQNHVLYNTTKNESTTYYDLNLETLQEEPMTITDVSVVKNWARNDDVTGAGYDYEAYNNEIDNSPIVNDCTYYNLTTNEIVGFPDITNFMCDQVLLK